MADRAILTVTGDADDLGRQPYTTTVDEQTLKLHGYPCDHIAMLQSRGHDVLVTGEVQVLPFGKHGYPDPVESPEGTIYPAIEPPLYRTPPASHEALADPKVTESARTITARLDRLEHNPGPEPPGIPG